MGPRVTGAGGGDDDNITNNMYSRANDGGGNNNTGGGGMGMNIGATHEPEAVEVQCLRDALVAAWTILAPRVRADLEKRTSKSNNTNNTSSNPTTGSSHSGKSKPLRSVHETLSSTVSRVVELLAKLRLGPLTGQEESEDDQLLQNHRLFKHCLLRRILQDLYGEFTLSGRPLETVMNPSAVSQASSAMARSFFFPVEAESYLVAALMQEIVCQLLRQSLGSGVSQQGGGGVTPRAYYTTILQLNSTVDVLQGFNRGSQEALRNLSQGSQTQGLLPTATQCLPMARQVYILASLRLIHTCLGMIRFPAGAPQQSQQQLWQLKPVQTLTTVLTASKHAVYHMITATVKMTQLKQANMGQLLHSGSVLQGIMWCFVQMLKYSHEDDTWRRFPIAAFKELQTKLPSEGEQPGLRSVLLAVMQTTLKVDTKTYNDLEKADEIRKKAEKDVAASSSSNNNNSSSSSAVEGNVLTGTFPRSEAAREQALLALGVIPALPRAPASTPPVAGGGGNGSGSGSATPPPQDLIPTARAAATPAQLLAIASPVPFIGLENMGNTCYANSILQALHRCLSFRNEVVHAIFANLKKGGSVIAQSVTTGRGPGIFLVGLAFNLAEMGCHHSPPAPLILSDSSSGKASPAVEGSQDTATTTADGGVNLDAAIGGVRPTNSITVPRQISQCQQGAIRPEWFIKNLPEPFFGGGQHDASEFCKSLFVNATMAAEMAQHGKQASQQTKEEVEKEEVEKAAADVIQKGFEAKSATTYECLQCGHCSTMVETQWDLMLNFPPAAAPDSSSGKTTASSAAPTAGGGDSGGATKIDPKEVPISTGAPSAAGGDDQTPPPPPPNSSPSGDGQSSHVVSNPLLPPPALTVTSPEEQAASNKSSATPAIQPSAPLSVQAMIEEAIGAGNKEDLRGDDRYQCDKCEAKVDATRYFRYLENAEHQERTVHGTLKPTKTVTCPKYMIVQLNRFTYNRKTFAREKIHTKTDLPLRITIPTMKTSKPTDPKEEIECPSALERVAYRLISTVVHSGVSLASGHYYSYVSDTEVETEPLASQHHPRNLGSSDDVKVQEEAADLIQPAPTVQQWYQCNDSTVTKHCTTPFSRPPLPEHQHPRAAAQKKSEQETSTTSSSSSSSANLDIKVSQGGNETPYLLFYQREDTMLQEVGAKKHGGCTVPATHTQPTVEEPDDVPQRQQAETNTRTSEQGGEVDDVPPPVPLKAPAPAPPPPPLPPVPADLVDTVAALKHQSDTLGRVRDEVELPVLNSLIARLIAGRVSQREEYLLGGGGRGGGNHYYIDGQGGAGGGGGGGGGGNDGGDNDSSRYYAWNKYDGYSSNHYSNNDDDDVPPAGGAGGWGGGSMVC